MRPQRVHTVLISTQHDDPTWTTPRCRDLNEVIKKVTPSSTPTPSSTQPLRPLHHRWPRRRRRSHRSQDHHRHLRRLGRARAAPSPARTRPRWTAPPSTSPARRPSPSSPRASPALHRPALLRHRRPRAPLRVRRHLRHRLHPRRGDPRQGEGGDGLPPRPVGHDLDLKRSTSKTSGRTTATSRPRPTVTSAATTSTSSPGRSPSLLSGDVAGRRARLRGATSVEPGIHVSDATRFRTSWSSPRGDRTVGFPPLRPARTTRMGRAQQRRIKRKSRREYNHASSTVSPRDATPDPTRACLSHRLANTPSPRPSSPRHLVLTTSAATTSPSQPPLSSLPPPRPATHRAYQPRATPSTSRVTPRRGSPSFRRRRNRERARGASLPGLRAASSSATTPGGRPIAASRKHTRLIVPHRDGVPAEAHHAMAAATRARTRVFAVAFRGEAKAKVPSAFSPSRPTRKSQTRARRRRGATRFEFRGWGAIARTPPRARRRRGGSRGGWRGVEGRRIAPSRRRQAGRRGRRRGCGREGGDGRVARSRGRSRLGERGVGMRRRGAVAAPEGYRAGVVAGGDQSLGRVAGRRAGDGAHAVARRRGGGGAGAVGCVFGGITG